MVLEKLKAKYSKKAFTTQNAEELGVSKRMLSYLVKRGELARIGRGRYTLPGVDAAGEDWKFFDLALVANTYKDATVCLISALSYWELTEEFPRAHWLAFPNNHPTVKNPMVRMYRPRNHDIGVMKIKLSGIDVRITDRERSMVDAFKYLEEESYLTSFKLYLEQEESKINIPRLINYAVELRELKLITLLSEIASAQAKSYPSLNAKAFRDTVKSISKIRITA